MDGKEWGGRLLRKCSRAERPWGGIEGSDINSCHDGVGKRHGERPNDLEEMVGVFYVGGEGFDNWLEVDVDVRRDTSSGSGWPGLLGLWILGRK